jgi:hypothetical protein
MHSKKNSKKNSKRQSKRDSKRHSKRHSGKYVKKNKTNKTNKKMIGGAAVAAAVAAPISNTFTIITTGIANWNETTTNQNIINFLMIILESLILNTFFGKFNNFNLINYDAHLNDTQKENINRLITNLQGTYEGINFKIQNIKSNLEQTTILPDVQNVNPYLTIHLDFANLDSVTGFNNYRDTYLNIKNTDGRDIGIKKIYFGYWEETYPPAYADIIKQIILMDIQTNRDIPYITTYIDKLKLLGFTETRYLRLFHSLPGDCPETPRSVITIPGFRTLYQEGGIDPVILFSYLWTEKFELLIKIQSDMYSNLLNSYLNCLSNTTNSDNTVCLFCKFVKCKNTNIHSIKELGNGNLCRICYNLRSKVGDFINNFNNYIKINTPPLEN